MKKIHDGKPNKLDVAEEEVVFIKERMNIRYLFDKNRQLFLDPRINVRDVLVLLCYLCDKYGINMADIKPFEKEVSINSIAEFVCENWKGQNDTRSTAG